MFGVCDLLPKDVHTPKVTYMNRAVPKCRGVACLATLAVITLFSTMANAIDPTETLSELHHTRWTTREGAPAGIAYLAQSSDGYLWIGANAGLYRFDGERFERFSLPNGEQPITDSVSTIFALPSNDLLVGMRFGGAFMLHNGQVTHYGVREGLPARSVTAFAVREDGSWWAQTTAGLYAFNGRAWTLVGTERNYPAATGYALTVGKDGTLWSRGSQGTFYLPRHATSFSKSAVRGGSGVMGNCADDRTWVVDVDRGISALPDTGSWIDPTTFGAHDWGAQYFFCDREGGMWASLLLWNNAQLVRIPDVVSFVKGGYRLRPEEVRMAKSTQAMPMSNLMFMFEDREGTVWAAAYDSLERFRSNKLHSALEGRGMTSPVAAVTPGGDVWLANGHQLLQFAPKVDSPAVNDHFIDPNGVITIDSMWVDRDGGAWIARRGGELWHYLNNRWERLPSPSDSSRSSIHAIVQDGQGSLWIAVVGNGLYRRDGAAWALNGGLSELPREVPLTLTTDAKGRLWCGYVGGQVAVIDGEGARMLRNLGQLQLGRISAIAVRDRAVWLAGTTSVGLYSQEHFWPIITDGPSFEQVSGIVQSDDGALWLSGNDGVKHIDASDVAAFMLDHHHQTHAELINYEDGLNGSPPSITQLPSAHEGGDGRVWITTTQGAYWINPKSVHRNPLPPPVLITSVVAAGNKYLTADKTTLPARTANFEVDYTALSLSMPSRVRFRYKLEGVDLEWQDAGTRRQAFYTNVPPGRHRFNVAAVNEDGVWNAVGASTTLIIPPAFYQTRWFLLLCCMAFVASIWQVYRLRLGQIRARLGERLRERERIARELHDTLIQSAQGLILIFQGFAGQFPKPDPMRLKMEGALDQADHLLNEARSRVTELRTAGIDEDIVEALTRAGKELFVSGPSQFILVTAGTPREIPQPFADEIYRIGREALVNAATHANAKAVEVDITFDAEAFRLAVRDDGRGMRAEVLQAGSRARHFGLQGMRERAQRLGAELTLWSREDAGTELLLVVPSIVVYSQAVSQRRWRLPLPPRWQGPRA
jgi:signal transduction histidine kinase/ligand-binding sensor domain-containing protein